MSEQNASAGLGGCVLLLFGRLLLVQELAFFQGFVLF